MLVARLSGAEPLGSCALFLLSSTEASRPHPPTRDGSLHAPMHATPLQQTSAGLASFHHLAGNGQRKESALGLCQRAARALAGLSRRIAPSFCILLLAGSQSRDDGHPHNTISSWAPGASSWRLSFPPATCCWGPGCRLEHTWWARCTEYCTSAKSAQHLGRLR